MPLGDTPLARAQLISPNSQLRDHFQGAILGIMLAPVALFCALARTHTRAIAHHYARQAAASVPLQLALVPTLLRYHDHSPAERHRRLIGAAHQSIDLDHDPVHDLAQQLMLSDILAWILKQCSQPPCSSRNGCLTLRWLADEIISVENLGVESLGVESLGVESLGAGDSALYYRYHALWADARFIFDHSNPDPGKSARKEERQHSFLSQLWPCPAALTAAEKSVYRHMIKGISSTVLQLSGHVHLHYSQLVATTANNISMPDVFLARGALPVSEQLADVAHRQASLFYALIPGLMAGAALGRCSLPVLWQQRLRWLDESLKLESGIAVANQCFDQWRGCLL